MKTFIIAFILVTLTACGESAEEKRQKYIDQQIAAAEQRQQYAPQQTFDQQQYSQQPYEQQYQQAPAQVIQQPAAAPVIVQSAPQGGDNSVMTNMLIGGLVGHAVSNTMNNNSRPAVPDYTQPQYREPIRRNNVTNITRNVTINRPVAQAPVVKRNSMDMNKLSSAATYKPPVSSTRSSTSFRRK
jgi:Tfp pilus assembly protein PilP